MTTKELNTIRNECDERLHSLTPYMDRIKSIQTKIKKIDLILNPRFYLITYQEKKYNHRYLQAKVYWVDNNGNITRSVTYHPGNMINYPLGAKDPETIQQVSKEISVFLMKKFGSLI